jgi:hypothetical protein
MYFQKLSCWDLESKIKSGKISKKTVFSINV